jgi:hypothetical protein
MDMMRMGTTMGMTTIPTAIMHMTAITPTEETTGPVTTTTMTMTSKALSLNLSAPLTLPS